MKLISSTFLRRLHAGVGTRAVVATTAVTGDPSSVAGAMSSSLSRNAIAVPAPHSHRSSDPHHQRRHHQGRAFTSTLPLGSVVGSASASSDGVFASFDPQRARAFEGNDVAGAMEALANADAVCFDVDSTVIQEEGIDVLADSLGKGEEVSAWTAQAMEGDVKFEDALAARLGILEPSRHDVERCLANHPLPLSPGIERLVTALRAKGVDVYLVSGGFRIMIEPVAETLGVPSPQNVFANTIFFREDDEEGSYVGFDGTEPTSADMGKRRALRRIKEGGNYDTMVMVGDGATDSQAKPPADAFIGYGGVVERDLVKKNSCWYVYDFEDMIEVVEKFGGSKRR